MAIRVRGYKALLATLDLWEEQQEGLNDRRGLKASSPIK